MKNMWIYHEKFHWIFMGFNFIVAGNTNFMKLYLMYPNMHFFFNEDEYNVM